MYAIYITIVQIASMFSTFKFELAIPIINNHHDRLYLLKISIINILLLILRTLIILCIILILSRPVIKGNYIESSTDADSIVVILIDNSFSKIAP